MKELTNEEIIQIYELQDIINSNFSEDKYYGFDLDLDSFFLRCRNLKPQVYGLRVQAYLSLLFKYKTTPSSLDCGDFKTRENEDVEFKCSFIDKISKKINVRQIRKWQDIDYYYIFTVDYTDYKNIIYKCYKLNKKEFKEECLLLNAQPIHSTKKSNENNDKVEYGFSINLDSEHFRRWEENYLNKKLDLKLLSEERLKEINTEKQKELLIETYKEEIIRLKVNHPEEIAKREAKIKELMDKMAEKRKKKEEAYYRKRCKAYNKIPKEILNKHIEAFQNGELSRRQLYSIIDYEIRLRYVRRKKKIKEELKPFPLNITCNRFYSKITNYEEFSIEFKHLWHYLNQGSFEEDLENEELQFNYNEDVEFSEKMRKCKLTSVY